MKFREFVLIEQDPMGGPPMGGGDPLMGGMGGPPPMGGGPMGGGPPPMGGDPMGGMGGPPMGGGPMGGGPPPPALPNDADVWEVLDSILNNKPLKEDKPKAPPQPPPMAPPPGGPPMGGDPMGGMGGGMNPPSPMGGNPLDSGPGLMQ